MKEKSFRFPGRTSLALSGISLLSLCVFAFGRPFSLYVLIGLTQQSARCSDGSCQAHEDLIAGFSAIESVAVAFDFCARRNSFVNDLLKRAAGDVFNDLPA